MSLHVHLVCDLEFMNLNRKNGLNIVMPLWQFIAAVNYREYIHKYLYIRRKR
jgi:hypothetical protein